MTLGATSTQHRKSEILQNDNLTSRLLNQGTLTSRTKDKTCQKTIVRHIKLEIKKENQRNT